jgi:hypothetical protein
MVFKKLRNMKKHIFISILILFLAPALYSQAPQSIPYQAVVRNTDGSVMAEAAMTITFQIHDNAATGTVVYEENHTATTNAQGLISLNVGNGSVVVGNFSGINWGSGNKFLHVLMNAGSGVVDLGTQQMMSVPYALFAEDVPVRVSVTGDSLFIGNQVSIVPGVSAANAILGCMDSQACNFDIAAMIDNSSCLFEGDLCNDLNSTTINDVFNSDCICIGEIVYSVGMTGPAGGWIVHDKGSYSNGWRYIEASKIVHGPLTWGSSGCNPSTNESIGFGLSNSTNINANCFGNFAAKYCLNLDQGGYSDWFLPSELELIRVYSSIQNTSLYYNQASYLTSNEPSDNDLNNAVMINFYVGQVQAFLNGGQSPQNKTQPTQFIPVRYF